MLGCRAMNLIPDSEEAFETLDKGIGRRDLLRATALVSAGATVPRWLMSPGVAAAAATNGGEPPVLQSGKGRTTGSYIASTPETIRWGYLPNRDSTPIGTVQSGSVVTIDTVSHEGILEDQGRDPVRYFAGYGISEGNVLDDAKAIAASELPHDFVADGPHIVTGPIAIQGAQPGDV